MCCICPVTSLSFPSRPGLGRHSMREPLGPLSSGQDLFQQGQYHISVSECQPTQGLSPGPTYPNTWHLRAGLAPSVLHNLRVSDPFPLTILPHASPSPHKPMLTPLCCSIQERSERPHKLRVSRVCSTPVPVFALSGLPRWGLNPGLVCDRGRFTRVVASPRFIICLHSTSLKRLF